MAKKNKFEWIEISLRGALVFSALFISILLIGLVGADYFAWEEEWVRPLIMVAATFFALRLSRSFFFVKNKKAKIFISSLGLTFLFIICLFWMFYR